MFATKSVINPFVSL